MKRKTSSREGADDVDRRKTMTESEAAAVARAGAGTSHPSIRKCS